MIHMAQPPNTWWVTATVTTAVTMKTMVAAIERVDSRPIPQMPWPEVQPPPSRVPKPTSSPAAAMTVQLAGSFGGAIAVADPAGDDGRQNQPGDEGDAPGLVLAPQIERPPKMPLMPAIRPVNSISSTAERPISAPPIAAEGSEIGHDEIPLV